VKSNVNEVADWLDDISKRDSEMGLWMCAGRIQKAADLLRRQHRALSEAYESFIEGQYKPSQCDCDPSVGIEGCLICEIRDLLREDCR